MDLVRDIWREWCSRMALKSLFMASWASSGEAGDPPPQGKEHADGDSGSMDQELVDRLGHPEPPILAGQHSGRLNRVHAEPLLVEVEVGERSAEEVVEAADQVESRLRISTNQGCGVVVGLFRLRL